MFQDTSHVDRGFNMLPAKLRQVRGLDIVAAVACQHLRVFANLLLAVFTRNSCSWRECDQRGARGSFCSLCLQFLRAIVHSLCVAQVSRLC